MEHPQLELVEVVLEVYLLDHQVLEEQVVADQEALQALLILVQLEQLTQVEEVVVMVLVQV